MAPQEPKAALVPTLSHMLALEDNRRQMVASVEAAQGLGETPAEQRVAGPWR